MLKQLSALPELPDGFACANDFLATRLMSALKQMGLSIPKDVMITGFGGTPESAIIDPPLTTAQIPSTDIGSLAATLLIRRIQMPDFPYHWTNVKTTPIWGESTR
jgi:LacI family transcriptional regulator